MAKKTLTGSLNQVRRTNENVFAIPKAMRGPVRPKYQNIKAAGLKPNTKYKVMLDNHPGSSFEDITDFAKPVGESKKVNTHQTGTGRQLYLKSDASGKLDFKVLTHGTDEVEVTGDAVSSSTNWDKLWKYYHTRSSANDKGRENVKLIAYSAVNNPDSADKVKTIKYNLTPTIEAGTGTTVTAGSGNDVTLPPIPLPEVCPPGIWCDCSLPPPGEVNKYLPGGERASYYQTFFIDADKVDRSETVDLLDVTLYIRSKPRALFNSSGKKLPGISIIIMDCESDGTPISTQRYAHSRVIKPWSQIKASPLATSGTRFDFSSPVRLRTNRYYTIAISLEDRNYALWFNKKGDLTLVDGKKTEERSQGSSKGHKGDLYEDNSDRVRMKPGQSAWQAQNDLDIKFDVHIAEYTISTVDIQLNNADYEFFDMYSANTGSGWKPGEIVYKEVPFQPGGITIQAGENKITGDGNTVFDDIEDGSKIVIIDSANTAKREVFTVDKSIAGSNSIMYVDEDSGQTISGNLMVTVVGELEYYDYYFHNIRLRDSSVNETEFSANNTLRFAAEDVIVGLDTHTEGQISGYKELPISVFRTNWNCTLPPIFKPVSWYNMSYSTGSGTYAISTGNTNVFILNAPNHLTDYEGVLISHSQEVDQLTLTNGSTSNEFKSGTINLRYEYQGANSRSYAAPTLDLEEIDIVTHRWFINNDGSDEHLNAGNALTRHISKTMQLGDASKAEDIRVILNAYRPTGTNLEVYAKIQNNADQQPFDDKHWTKLEIISGADQYSDKSNRFDYRELEFSFSNYSTSTDLSGTFTTTLDSDEITTTTANVELVTATDVIKVQSPLFPENYQLYSVESVNAAANSITLSQPVSNVNIVGEGFIVSVMDSTESAFRNPDNYNAVSYFTENGDKFDNYNKVAIKIVMLAESRRIVPKVDDYRVVAVTA